ncbi:MAG TPA: hypothetical protein PLR86_09955, partial [Planctomycetota bacterium]|nr:hypothetical protein [Planctomycetota bacterium]
MEVQEWNHVFFNLYSGESKKILDESLQHLHLNRGNVVLFDTSEEISPNVWIRERLASETYSVYWQNCSYLPNCSYSSLWNRFSEIF